MYRKPRQTRKRMIAIAAAALCVPIFAGSAFADHNDRGRNNNRRHVERNDRHDRHDSRRHKTSRRHDRHDHSSKSRIFFRFGSPNVRYESSNHHYGGYYRHVWHPAAYVTRYDACGNPYTVLVRAGYYQKVWAPYTHRHQTHSRGRHHRSGGIVIGGSVRF